jgi:hypothetical protein
MAAHGVPEDALPHCVDRKMGGDNVRQFVANVAGHLVVGRVRLTCGVDVEARARPECPVRLVVGNVVAARARVGTDNGNSKFRSGSTIPPLSITFW